MPRVSEAKQAWTQLLILLGFGLIIFLSYAFLSIVPRIPKIAMQCFVIIAIIYLIIGILAPPVIILCKRKFPAFKWYLSIVRLSIGDILFLASIMMAGTNLGSGGPTHTVSYLLFPLAKFNIVTVIAIWFFIMGLLLIFVHFFQLYIWHKKKYFYSLTELQKP
jgi:hypothetical protein